MSNIAIRSNAVYKIFGATDYFLIKFPCLIFVLPSVYYGVNICVITNA